MAFIISSLLWQSVGFLSLVIHSGCFSPVFEFLLNDCTLRELNFNSLCVSVDTGGMLWPACAKKRRLLYLLQLALSGCCHAAAIRKKTLSHQKKNAHITNNSSLCWMLTTVYCYIVLNPSPLPPSLVHDLCFLVSVSSTLEGWDSFTKCTLYVFQSFWEGPDALISLPI